MAHPAYYVASTSPIGLIAVAGAGYLAYRLGKKSGAEEDGKNILNQAFKGTVKTVYRAKMAIGEGLEDRKKRFSELWDDALAEARK
ncbi:MAG: hypothetical protein JRF43_02365 [Deltaproteobacteria bacterium]|nr:hypothetical protein [Deltaproteobacteria bacterium]